MYFSVEQIKMISAGIVANLKDVGMSIDFKEDIIHSVLVEWSRRYQEYDSPTSTDSSLGHKNYGLYIKERITDHNISMPNMELRYSIYVVASASRRSGNTDLYIKIEIYLQGEPMKEAICDHVRRGRSDFEFQSPIANPYYNEPMAPVYCLIFREGALKKFAGFSR